MSTPNLVEFTPEGIAWQDDFVDMFYNRINWSLGLHEFLLSGSIGSAKSLVCAHLGIRHCLENRKANLLIARRALPDLKDTIFLTIKEHLEGALIEGKDYWINEQRAQIEFRNGSMIISRSWADRKYKKLRSLNLSAAIVEEGSENDSEDEQAFKEIRGRIGRVPHIKQNFLLIPTNPDTPDHFLYKYYVLGAEKYKTRHVIYSLTKDNIYLPDWYVKNLYEMYDAHTAEMLLEGKWLHRKGVSIYHAYSKDNFINQSYKINTSYPIAICFDFNIGVGKPFSLCLFQYINGVFHVFAEVIIEGMRTLDAMEELLNRGLLNHDTNYIIYGDATGKARSTQSKIDNYEQIQEFLSATKIKRGAKESRIRFEMRVPVANPPIRARHLEVNAKCKNANGKISLLVYKDAPTVDEGLRLTRLKKGGEYIEDDGPQCPYQHVTTALGYGIMSVKYENESSGESFGNL